jgi:hypothetical protein
MARSTNKVVIFICTLLSIEAKSSLGSNPDISQKYTMGYKIKEWPTHSKKRRKKAGYLHL